MAIEYKADEHKKSPKKAKEMVGSLPVGAAPASCGLNRTRTEIVTSSDSQERLAIIQKPKRGRPSKESFNKAAYNRAYMADKRKASKLGLSVKEWRKIQGETK